MDKINIFPCLKLILLLVTFSRNILKASQSQLGLGILFLNEYTVLFILATQNHSEGDLQSSTTIFQEHCFFCWFPMALASSDLGRLYCYSYAGLKIDTSLATNQINYYPCLYNVFHIQVLARVCALCTIFTGTDNFSASSSMLIMGRLCC